MYGEKAPGRVLGSYIAKAVITFDNVIHIKDILSVDPEGNRLEIHHNFRDTTRDTLLQVQLDNTIISVPGADIMIPRPRQVLRR